MKTSATKDIPYERCALKHKSKAFSLELALIPLTFFPYYNFPAVIYPPPSRACLTHSQEHFTPAHRTCIFSKAFMSKKCLTVRKARNTLKPPIDAPRSDFLILSLHTNACQIHTQAGGAQPVSPGGCEELMMVEKKALNIVWLQRPQDCTCQGHAEFATRVSLGLQRLLKTGMICYLHKSIDTSLSHRCTLSIFYWVFQFLHRHTGLISTTAFLSSHPLCASTVPCVIFLQFRTALKVKFVTKN